MKREMHSTSPEPKTVWGSPPGIHTAHCGGTIQTASSTSQLMIPRTVKSSCAF
jgi:hypothetical protein